MPGSHSSLIVRNAQIIPNQVAPVMHEKEPVWAESPLALKRTAGAVQALCAKPGDRVAIRVMNSDHCLA